MTWWGYDIPLWLTEARLAALVAVLSAVFTGGSLLYTRRLALNDTQRMKRKPPVFEVSSHTLEQNPEWLSVHIVARNFEPVAVAITGYRHKGRSVSLVSHNDIMSETPFGQGPDYDHLEALSGDPEISARSGIGASGTQAILSDAPHVRRPTEHMLVYAKGPFRRDQFTVIWEWADGTPP